MVIKQIKGCDDFIENLIDIKLTCKEDNLFDFFLLKHADSRERN